MLRRMEQETANHNELVTVVREQAALIVTLRATIAEQQATITRLWCSSHLTIQRLASMLAKPWDATRSFMS
jgi:uncharacterized coiled-coil protein SlyX